MNSRKVRRNNKITAIVLMICLIVTCTANVYANEKDHVQDDFKIATVDELKDEINDLLDDGKITNREKRELISETDPNAIKEFVQEKINDANDKVNEILPNLTEQPDGSYSQHVSLDIGDGCSVDFECTDKEESVYKEQPIDINKDLLDNNDGLTNNNGVATDNNKDLTDNSEDADNNEDLTIADRILNFFAEPVYAAENGEHVSKGFGNRYFTAVERVWFPIGTASLKLEHHYKITDNGLVNRDPLADYHFVGAVYGVNYNTATLNDKATKYGDKIGVRCKYQITSGVGFLNASVSYTITAYAKFLGFNVDKKNNKRTGALIEQSWKLS